MEVSKWKSQVRKGLIEYGLLNLIQDQKKVYGLQIIEALKADGLTISEGTLYPLMSRLVREKVLDAYWETKNLSGHPRKYYKLTTQGRNMLKIMNDEWDQLVNSISSLRGEKNNGRSIQP